MTRRPPLPREWTGLDEEHLKWLEGQVHNGYAVEDADSAWLCRKLREALAREALLERTAG